MTTELISSMALVAWSCNVTLFASFYNPLPADELEDATFVMLVHRIAPADGPAVGDDKDVLPFFVPGLLKVAPLTVKMQEKTKRKVGKQRSAAHVTEAMFLVLDVDGLTQAQFDALLERLRTAGITFLTYSTHSHGRADKPGVRARLLIPVDRPLSGDEYKAAWLGFDILFCDGAIAAADDSGKAMWQQQGMWSAHPDRVEAAFRIVHKSGIALADALIAAGMKVSKPTPERREYVAQQLPVTMEIQRIVSALPWLDSETTSKWTSLVVAFKALVPVIGYDAAQELAIRYSEQAGEAAKANNDDSRYNPSSFFENATPTMPPEAAKGFIYGAARDGALVEVERGLVAGNLGVRGSEAATYLARHHRTALRDLLTRNGVEVAA